MKLDIFSHCTIDTIEFDNSVTEQIGGVACYGGLTARKLKFDVTLHTKFGPDFPYDEYLTKNKLTHENAQSNKPTTRFTIKLDGADRIMYLANTCEPIEYGSSKADGFLVSPVFDEISTGVFENLKKDCDFVFLDPQGFLRRIDSEKKVFLEKTNINLSNINTIKLSYDEIKALSDGATVDDMKNMQKRGVEHVLLTNKKEISLLVNDRIYSITLPNNEIYDTTGLGDIFFTTFCCTLLKENDFLWALCFAGGASQAALDTKEFGLKKIPEKNDIETNGSYFYNTVKFKQV
ncbi:MAG: PfkB family carbohydrate kinase [Nitrosopumilaceae archaeon]